MIAFAQIINLKEKPDIRIGIYGENETAVEELFYDLVESISYPGSTSDIFAKELGKGEVTPSLFEKQCFNTATRLLNEILIDLNLPLFKPNLTHILFIREDIFNNVIGKDIFGISTIYEQVIFMKKDKNESPGLVLHILHELAHLRSKTVFYINHQNYVKFFSGIVAQESKDSIENICNEISTFSVELFAYHFYDENLPKDYISYPYYHQFLMNLYELAIKYDSGVKNAYDFLSKILYSYFTGSYTYMKFLIETYSSDKEFATREYAEGQVSPLSNS